jgi:hypothetical protein
MHTKRIKGNWNDQNKIRLISGTQTGRISCIIKSVDHVHVEGAFEINFVPRC